MLALRAADGLRSHEQALRLDGATALGAGPVPALVQTVDRVLHGGELALEGAERHERPLTQEQVGAAVGQVLAAPINEVLWLREYRSLADERREELGAESFEPLPHLGERL